MFNRKTSRLRPRRGYTLIEVLLVVAILGIVGAAVVPSMLSAGTMGVQAAARIVVADLLFAQNEAIAQQTARGVIFNPAGESYRLVDEGGSTLTVEWMNGKANNYQIDFTKDTRFTGVTIEAANFGGTSQVTFDALGSPSSGGFIDIRYHQAAYRIDVAAFTGRVTVSKYVPSD